MNSEVFYDSSEGRHFRFNDHICVEMLLGCPDELRTGRLVQIRKGVGAFGSDVFILRIRDGSLRSFENVMIRHVGDDRFEDAFYISNGKQPPVVPDQPVSEEDSTEDEYNISGKWPETGFVISEPSQPESPTQMFGITITTPK